MFERTLPTLVPIVWTTLGTLLATIPGAGQSVAVDSARIRTHIGYLAADALEGRGVGTAGLDSAAAYVARALAASGLTPLGTDGYRQPFTIAAAAPAAAHAGVGGAAVVNVIGAIPGRGALADEVVVIGAHYDHLGFGGFGSLDGDSAIHNGADDNASGTAVLLEVARVLAAWQPSSARTVVVAAFTAEELGLIGSEHLVQNPTWDFARTYAMVNLDMVGRLTDDRLAVFGAETASEFIALLDSLNTDHGFDLAASGDGWGRSDQQSFFAAGVPVLHLFTGTHEDYHRASDDPETIAVGGAARIAAFVTQLTETLATRTTALTFVDAEPPPPPVGGGYGAYLGTIPDMTDSPGGVRLSGVRAGSPADQAGLQAGDILVGLGDTEIADLYDMTDALRAHRPGDTVTVRVRRDDAVIDLTAVLGRRGG